LSDVKKYYYMRLKDNFFDDEVMKLMEGMQDGYLYQNILLKLYLMSLKNGGKLAVNGVLPYSANMIATVTRHQIGTVEKALELFQKIGLIEVLDSGIIYMANIQNYIGSSSSEADRKREYRKEIDTEKALEDKCPTNVRQTSTIINSNKQIDNKPLDNSQKQIANSKKPSANSDHQKVTRENIQRLAQSEALTDAMMEFVDHRNRLKATMTFHAVDLMLRKLQELAPDDEEKKIQILEQSILKGWKGVFQLQEDSRPNNGESSRKEEPKTWHGHVLQ